MFLSGDELTNAITGLLRDSQSPRCAVAFLGGLASELIPNGARVICNLESGATNPDAVSALLNRGVKIKRNPRLHAKVYLGDRYAVVASANLSANGLSLEDGELTGWLEAGYQVSDSTGRGDIEGWWERLWGESWTVDERDLEQFRLRWEGRRASRPVVLEEGLMEVLRDKPERLRDRRIYIAISRDDQLSKEAVAAYEESGYASGSEDWDCYEGWPGLPKNAYLIDFYLGPRYGVIYRHVWRTPEEHIEFGFKYRDGTDATIKMCLKASDVAGVRITADDGRALSKRIGALWDSELGGCEPYAKVIEILAARDVLLGEMAKAGPKSRHASTQRR